MDFSTFVITGPNTVTTSIFYNLFGSITATGGSKVGVPSSFATECLTDTFSVTGSGGTTPPVICGTNTGYHSKLNSVSYPLPGCGESQRVCNANKL